MKPIPLIAACGFTMVVPFMFAANAHDIIIENWKPCATGFQRKDGERSWLEIPAWARIASLRPWYYGDPRLLANHGLCNAKFHRVVLCLPGWQESDDQNAGWFKVCRDWEALQDWKRNNQ
jgi:hypothetical protein